MFFLAFHHKCAKTTTKCKALLVLLAFMVAAFLSACGGVNNESNGNTSIDSLEHSTTDAAQPQSSTESSTAAIVSVNLKVEVVANSQYLADKGNGVYYVGLPDEGVDYPAMPTYSWYINGTESEKITDVVLEFDLIDTVAPLDNEYFGYDRGYFITLHNFETIPLTPSWWEGSTNNLGKYGDTNRAAMILMPELGVDLQKFVTTEIDPDDTTHVQIAIPYSQFQTASKDLTLQFLPGTTFGNLAAYVRGSGVTETTVERISQTIDYGFDSEEIIIEEIWRNFNLVREGEIPRDRIIAGLLNRTEVGNSIEHSPFNEGLFVNPDGSVNMHISFYDLEEYADEIQGEYVVVPEGLVSAFTTMSVDNSFHYSTEDKRAVVELALSMIDENGQFAGVYDISQGKIVATERKVAALPIFSAMCGYLTDSERDSIANKIIANCIVRIGDTLYYAPNGLSEDGVLDLTLDDFVINGSFLRLMNDYSMDPNRLKEKFGCAKLMEAFTNSFQLILEGQEMNETRLPSSELRVTFSSDGSYELQPSETFVMKGSYVSMGPASYESLNAFLIDFRFEQDDNRAFDTWMNKVADDKNGDYSENQSQYIREAAAMYSEVYNAYKIINTYYESFLDVYNFIKTQPVSTIYGPGYNVHTGEMIPDEDGTIYSNFSLFIPFRERFGTPAVSMNWFQITGLFNDEARMRDTIILVMNNNELYKGRVMGTAHVNFANPDAYADIGLNIWGGYDSLKHVTPYRITATECTRFLFGASGHSLNRENTDELIRRTLNQFLDADHQLGPDDAIPLFYDDIPSVDIVEPLGN